MAGLLLLCGCSTQKNTWAARRYHALTTRYNVRFNGQESYRKGMEQMEQQYHEDYSELLPVYLSRDHTLSRIGAGNMKTSIQKCEKAIKQHSIRVKPEKKPARNASEKEKQFYAQEEFNPVMGSVFLLMTKAQFQSGDYLAATATASYTLRHFPQDRLLCDECRLWTARAYMELEWMYEAENILVKMNEEGFSRELSGFYATVYADYLIRREAYADAIPFVEIALAGTDRRRDRQRYTYLLAQLYQTTGNRRRAYELYGSIPRMNPPYEMDLNARIRQTEVYDEGSQRQALRKLRRMSRSPNNRNYLDAIYYAMGNIWFSQSDTAQAVECYRQAIDRSTQNGPYKAQALVSLGGFYYDTEDFRPAQPCYDEAKSLIKEEKPQYALVEERSRVLGELCPYLEVIFVEDSLQAVAAMPEAERDHLIDSLIAVARKQAREEARRQAREEALSANQELTDENRSRNEVAADQPNLLANGDNSWYFYNEAAKTAGRKEFERNWGRRKLEDNWRIKNKDAFFAELENTFGSSAAGGSQEQLPADVEPESDSESATEEEIDRPEVEFEPSDDPLQVGYYLKDLPLTEEQLAESEARVAEAMFQAGMVYRETMRNDDLALRTFAGYRERFPEDSLYTPEICYVSFLLLSQAARLDEAEDNRSFLLDNFPETPQAEKLRDSLYLPHLRQMYAVQDSLYAATYDHFVAGTSDSVKLNCQLVEDRYAMTPLRPKFLFLRALEAVKDSDGDTFVALISEIASKYPDTDLADLASEMLAYWNDGRRPVGFSNFYLSSGMTLEDSIAQARLEQLAEKFTYDPSEAHVLAFGYSPDSINANKLLFDVALYNFTNFLVRDYELSLEKIGEQDVLMVRSFEDAKDVQRYAAWLTFQGIDPAEKYPGLKLFIFSESNLQLVQEEFPEEAYRLFYEQHYRTE